MSALLNTAIQDEVELERILKPSGISSLEALFSDMKTGLVPSTAAPGSTNSITGRDMVEWMRKRIAGASESDMLYIGRRLVRDGFAIQLSPGQLRFAGDATYRLADRVRFRRSVSSPMLVERENGPNEDGRAAKGSELQGRPSPKAASQKSFQLQPAPVASNSATSAKSPAVGAGSVRFARNPSNSELESPGKTDNSPFATTRSVRKPAARALPSFANPPPSAASAPAGPTSPTSASRKAAALPSPPPLTTPATTPGKLKSVESSGDVSSAAKSRVFFANMTAGASGGTGIASSSSVTGASSPATGKAPAPARAPATTASTAASPAPSSAASSAGASSQVTRVPGGSAATPPTAQITSPRPVAATNSGPIYSSPQPAQTTPQTSAQISTLSRPPTRPAPVLSFGAPAVAAAGTPPSGSPLTEESPLKKSTSSSKKSRKDKKEKRDKTGKKEKREKRSKERSDRTLRALDRAPTPPLEPDQPHRSRAPLAPLEALAKIDLSSSPPRSAPSPTSASAPASSPGFGGRAFLRARHPTNAAGALVAPLTTMGKRGMAELTPELDLSLLRDLNLDLIAVLERGLAPFPLPASNDSSRAAQYELRLIEWLLAQLLSQQKRLQAGLDGNLQLAEQLPLAAAGVPLYLLYSAWLPVLEGALGRLLSSREAQLHLVRSGGPAALVAALHILPAQLPRIAQVLQRLCLAAPPQAGAAVASVARLQREMDQRSALPTSVQRVWDLNQRLEPGQALPPGFPSLAECLNVETTRVSSSGDDNSSSRESARDVSEFLRLESVASRASPEAEEQGHVLLLFTEVVCFATLQLGARKEAEQVDPRPLTLQPKICLSLGNLEVRDLPDANQGARYLLELSYPLSKTIHTFSFATEEVKSLWLDRLPPYRRVLRVPVEL